MITRELTAQLSARLAAFPAVVLLGPRQVGKTTLARALAQEVDAVYIDLESPRDVLRLSDPLEFFAAHPHQRIVLDEIQRLPALFPILRGVIDEDRRQGRGLGRFLLLGSASLDLLQQSAESLAGRAAYLELTPFLVSEVAQSPLAQRELWIRGGYPESFLAANAEASLVWRQNFLATYLEREIPHFGGRLPVTTLRNFWTMLAHEQGTMLNSSRLAQALGLSNTSVIRYLDLFCDLFLLRRLQPWHVNTKKRLVRTPKVYVRDSGLVHALLNLHDYDAVVGHPVAGASWEGQVIENLLASLPLGASAGFYRTSAGAEIDLVLSLPPHERWAVEIKRSSATPPGKGFHIACEDVEPTAKFVVYAQEERFPLPHNVTALGPRGLLTLLRERSVAR